MNPVLTAVRRLLIFFVFLGLLINGALLVMASQARLAQTRQQGSGQFMLRVKLPTRQAADSLVSSVRKDQASLSPRIKDVQEAKITEDVPTGKWLVSIDLDSAAAPAVARALTEAHNNVELVPGDGGRSIVRLKAQFPSKAQAEARARAVSNSVNGFVVMSATEGRRLQPVTIYTVEMDADDEKSLDALRQYVLTKVPATAVEP